jgi:hypothetical protein
MTVRDCLFFFAMSAIVVVVMVISLPPWKVTCRLPSARSVEALLAPCLARPALDAAHYQSDWSPR